MTHSPLLDIALDLSANLATEDRYRRLMDAVARLVPCDSAALLRLTEDGQLVPVATRGLRPDVEGWRFDPGEHPRLQRILSSTDAVRFTGSRLPDPFDGLLEEDPEATTRIHACMGAPLVVEGEVIGVLAMDAVDPAAFDAVDDADVATLAALAGAAMRTASLVDALEESCKRCDLEARELRHEVQLRGGGEIIGTSAPIQQLRDEIELCAGHDLTVLVTGETGSGKELVARAVHRRSNRRGKPLIYVNCAALPESIAESELFGHVRGAFSGAHDHRAGRFEAADGGTLLLDEIGELPLAIQPKLLRVLQSGEIQRVGSDRTLRVDVRVVAATNRDLEEEVAAGRFRADLYHRLSVFPITAPPLRDRPSDVPLLAGYFLDRSRGQLGLGPVRLTMPAIDALMSYDWPGNVRELEHVVTRAALRAAKGERRQPVVVQPEHLGLSPHVPRVADDGSGNGHAREAAAPQWLATARELPLGQAADLFRRHRIAEAVEANEGNWAAAARDLGIDRGNLHRLGKRLGLL